MTSIFFLSELTHDELIQVKASLQRQHTNARADAQLCIESDTKLKLMRLVDVLDRKLMRIYNEFERRAGARTSAQSLYPW